MIKKSIGTLADQIRGVSYKKKNLHDTLDKNSVILLRANNIVNGKLDFTDVLYVDKSVVSDTQYLKYGDILISASSGSKKVIGKAASFHSQCKCTFGAFCKVIRPHEDVREFLRIYFQSSAYRRQISHLALGANINNIRNEHIDSLQLGIPNETTRKKIVNKIDLLQKIIIRRQQMLFDLDELIKARFVEMFGDLTINDRGWKTENFSCVFKSITSSKRILKSEWKSKGIPFLRVRDLVQLSEKGVLNNEFFISNELYSKLSDNDGVTKNGDILVSATSTLGKCYIINSNEQLYFKDADVLRFRPSNKINAVYFTECMNDHFIQKQIDHNLGVTTVKHFTIKAAKSILIRIPPLSLQNKFATFVQQVDKSKVAVQKSLEETQTLFDSLMQKYFG